MILGLSRKFKVRVLKYNFSTNLEHNRSELLSRIKWEYTKFESSGITLYSIILVTKNAISWHEVLPNIAFIRIHGVKLNMLFVLDLEE